MILVEMVHDARIIPLDKSNHATDFEKWMGDSVAYWEGDTLVVKTRDFHPQQSFRGSSEELLITERFSLQGDDKIKYAFTLEDPLSYTQPWTGEIAMNRKPAGELMYEYACHEGNYAFPWHPGRRKTAGAGSSVSLEGRLSRDSSAALWRSCCYFHGPAACF